MARPRTILLHMAAAIVCVTTSAAAGPYKVLAHLSGQEGESTAPLVRGSDGAFYGTTRSGGVYGQGSVFRLTVRDHGFAFTTLHAFSGPDGAVPSGPLVQAADGFLYGTTAGGGAGEAGTIFRISHRGRVRRLYSFDRATTGGLPQAGLIQASDGSFYGTTLTGGAGEVGTVFRLDQSGAVTVLHAFDYTTGASPQAPLIQGRSGLLYGTTASGGTSLQGVLFSIDGGGNLTVLHSFNEYTTGSLPIGGVIEARDGLLYGITFNGGAAGAGTLFRATTAGVVTVLRSFDPATVGGHPLAGLVEGSDGALYGTTGSDGSRGFGTVFRFERSGRLEVLHAFDAGTTGRYPSAALMEGRPGVFYGTTVRGGLFGPGAIFEVSTSGHARVLHAFEPGAGILPLASLVQGSDGAFYGIARQRGGWDAGAIFRVNLSGRLRRLYSFDGSIGSLPSAALLEAADGLLYSTAESGGAGGVGSIFRTSRNGHVDLLHSFMTSDGEDPSAPLVRHSDGYFYGTACRGGQWGQGTVFRANEAGAVTVIQSFDSDTGGCPLAALVEGDDGALYGTTFEGGPRGNGTIFRVDTAGQLAVLHAFDRARTGALPTSALVSGPGGYLYGTAYSGGPLGFGTVFRISLRGDMQVLHAFDGRTDGGYPAGALVRGRDGSFYGTTSAGFWGTTDAGAAAGSGTIFRIDRRGKLISLHAFDGAHGSHPVAALIEATDGRLYGTAALGGAYGGGVVFRVTIHKQGRDDDEAREGGRR